MTLESFEIETEIVRISILEIVSRASEYIIDSKEIRTKNGKMAKLLYSIVILATLTSMCSGSAIPMWEFLGRTEKVSKSILAI